MDEERYRLVVDVDAANCSAALVLEGGESSPFVSLQTSLPRRQSNRHQQSGEGDNKQTLHGIALVSGPTSLSWTSASTQKFRYTESGDARAGQGAPTQAYWEYVEEAERSPA